MADLTPAEELRAAAARLRKTVGDELLLGLLDARGPLAAWLEEAAHQADMNAHRAPRHRRDMTAALAVARTLLGGGRG